MISFICRKLFLSPTNIMNFSDLCFEKQNISDFRNTSRFDRSLHYEAVTLLETWHKLPTFPSNLIDPIIDVIITSTIIKGYFQTLI